MDRAEQVALVDQMIAENDSATIREYLDLLKEIDQISEASAQFGNDKKIRA
jgi:hypothetical protein